MTASLCSEVLDSVLNFSTAFYFKILNSQLFLSANIFNSQNWISTRILRVCKCKFRVLIFTRQNRRKWHFTQKSHNNERIYNFLLYFIISTLLLDLKTIGFTRFILIFIKLFWVLKLYMDFPNTRNILTCISAPPPQPK